MTILHLIMGLRCGGAENQLQQLVSASKGNRELADEQPSGSAEAM
jgi:hypothetical protein